MALADNETAIRYLHILSGITWIGMLYFFNLVNLPLIKFSLKKPYEANMAEKATGHITIKTLFWFRWGAMFTLIFGILLAYIDRDEFKAYFQPGSLNMMNGFAIMLGMTLGLLMFINVWFVIWPRQKKILANNKAIAASTDDAEKKRLGDLNAPMVKMATLASRFNTWASIAMLWGMVFGAHGYTANATFKDWTVPFIILLAVYAIMWAYSSQPKPKQA